MLIVGTSTSTASPLQCWLLGFEPRSLFNSGDLYPELGENGISKLSLIGCSILFDTAITDNAWSEKDKLETKKEDKKSFYDDFNYVYYC